MASESTIMEDGLVFISQAHDSDAPAYAAYLKQLYSESQHYLPQQAESFFTFEAVLDRLKQPPINKRLYFLWTDGNKTELIGQVSFSGITYGVFKSCFLGYDILQNYQGRGIMTAGLSLVIPKFFQSTGLHRIQANVIPDNEASIRVLEKTGFMREGYQKNYLKINGEWQDHIAFALLNE